MNDAANHIPTIAALLVIYSVVALIFPRLYGKGASRWRALGIGVAAFIVVGITAPKPEVAGNVAASKAGSSGGVEDKASAAAPTTTEQRAVSPAPPQPAQPKALRMSPNQLNEAVENNEIAIRRRVDAAGGVIVRGRVTGVETTFWTVQISLAGGNPYLPVIAHMRSGNTDFAADLNRGQTVSLICKDVKKIVVAALYDCAPHVEPQ